MAYTNTKSRNKRSSRGQRRQARLRYMLPVLAICAGILGCMVAFRQSPQASRSLSSTSFKSSPLTAANGAGAGGAFRTLSGGHQSLNPAGRSLLRALDAEELSDYPPEAFFSESDLKHGAVVLHVLGVFYMFIALAIVCDEFFVPALERISEGLDLSDDVAGATFMAAGGSAPELFTSFVGVFISKSDVGFGTIVGSAVFNILFVIGVCAVVTPSVLALTWWPLFRDSTCYCIALSALVICFWDGEITAYESAILLGLYAGYVGVMSQNEFLQAKVSALYSRLRNSCCARSKSSKTELIMNSDLERQACLAVESALEKRRSNRSRSGDDLRGPAFDGSQHKQTTDAESAPGPAESKYDSIVDIPGVLPGGPESKHHISDPPESLKYMVPSVSGDAMVSNPTSDPAASCGLSPVVTRSAKPDVNGGQAQEGQSPATGSKFMPEPFMDNQRTSLASISSAGQLADDHSPSPSADQPWTNDVSRPKGEVGPSSDAKLRLQRKETPVVWEQGPGQTPRSDLADGTGGTAMRPHDTVSAVDTHPPGSSPVDNGAGLGATKTPTGASGDAALALGGTPASVEAGGSPSVGPSADAGSKGGLSASATDGKDGSDRDVEAGNGGDEKKAAGADGNGDGDDDDDEDMLAWPDSRAAQVWFVFTAPLMYSMSYTIPDVRKDNLAKLYPLSFILSIAWIAVFSYLMVWWATVIGVVVGIPSVVMGLTFIAAGTSVPDLLSSVIVAKQGLGDMAVSSSIGSNIFDVLIGLPLPWLLYSLIKGKDVQVETEGLQFAIILLLLMIVTVVGTIALSGWKLSKRLGAAMFVLYAIYVAINLMVEYDVFSPPISP